VCAGCDQGRVCGGVRVWSCMGVSRCVRQRGQYRLWFWCSFVPFLGRVLFCSFSWSGARMASSSSSGSPASPLFHTPEGAGGRPASTCVPRRADRGAC
jgi:hypothetical protein